MAKRERAFLIGCTKIWQRHSAGSYVSLRVTTRTTDTLRAFPSSTAMTAVRRRNSCLRRG